MALTDFNKEKSLDVASISGTPTVSRAVPIKITSGDDSTTGTGEIFLDWVNILSESDIAVYDENDNLLDYWIEDFDATAETAVVHVYRDWVRDGSTQAKVVYGNGPSDQSVSKEIVFDKESNLRTSLLLNESSGNALDATSNNNNARVAGATQNVSGRVNGAYAFDGADDYLSFSNNPDLKDNGAVSVWVKPNNDTKSTIFSHHAGGDNRLYFGINNFDVCSPEELFVGVANGSECTGVTLAIGQWNQIVFEWENGSFQVYKNGVEQYSDIYTGSVNTDVSDWEIGRYVRDGNQYFDGKIDSFFAYSSALSTADITATYDASKATPDFFSQQSGESLAQPVSISSEAISVMGPLPDVDAFTSLASTTEAIQASEPSVSLTAQTILPSTIGTISVGEPALKQIILGVFVTRRTSRVGSNTGAVQSRGNSVYLQSRSNNQVEKQ